MDQRSNFRRAFQSSIATPVSADEWNEFFPRNTTELHQFFIEQKNLVDAYNRANPGVFAGGPHSSDLLHQPASLAFLAASAAYAPLGFRTNPYGPTNSRNNALPAHGEVRNVAHLIKRIIALKVVEKRLTIRLAGIRNNQRLSNHVNQAVVIPARVVPYEEVDDDLSEDDYDNGYGYDTPPSSEDSDLEPNESEDDEGEILDSAMDDNEVEVEIAGGQEEDGEQGEAMEQEEVSQAINEVAQPALFGEEENSSQSDSSEAEPEWTLQEKLKLQTILKNMSCQKKANELKEKRSSLLEMGRLVAGAVESKVWDINNEIGNVNQQSLKDVVFPVEQSDKYDWAKVARMLNTNKTAAECRDLWQLYLHPCYDSRPRTPGQDREMPNNRGRELEPEEDTSDEES